MPTIHHAIVKSAAAKGFILSLDDETVVAHHPADNTRVIYAFTDEMEPAEINELAKAAWADCGDLSAWKADEARSAGITIAQDDEHDWIVSAEGVDDDAFDTLADAIAAADELKADPEDEAADEEAEEDHGSVVPGHFKALYREIGIRHQDNGDFLAKLFVDYCLIMDGKAELIDCAKVELLASRNGVDYPLESYNGYVQDTRGWQGRYRMTVGNMLRKKIADRNEAIVPASLTGKDEVTRVPPPEFVSKYATKPKGKKAKAEAEAAQAELTKPE